MISATLLIPATQAAAAAPEKVHWAILMAFGVMTLSLLAILVSVIRAYKDAGFTMDLLESQPPPKLNGRKLAHISTTAQGASE